MGTAARKAIDVRDEAVELGALPIQAEVAHDALAIAARIGGEMVLGCAPRLESGMIEVEAPVLVQKATQRADDPLLMDIVAPRACAGGANTGRPLGRRNPLAVSGS